MAHLRAHHRLVRLSGGDRIADPLIVGDRPGGPSTAANARRRTDDTGWQRVKVGDVFVDVDELFRWADGLRSSLRRQWQATERRDTRLQAEMKTLTAIIKSLRRAQPVLTKSEQTFITERRPGQNRRRAGRSTALSVDGVPVARRSIRSALRRKALDLDRQGQQAAAAALHFWADRVMELPDDVAFPPLVVRALQARIRTNGGTPPAS